MAFPVILIDSATGSDTAASGAGPATALTGSAASTDGTGLVVTLDGSPDLSGVATDGSHVIYLADTTAGARNFGKITAVDNGADTVTVSNAFGVSLSGKSWAIGGERASIGSTTSIKLIRNNAAAGDAMPGWSMEMQSGHSETLSASVTVSRSGDVVDGPITICGKSGAGTLPLLTFSNNGSAFVIDSRLYIKLKDFELRNTNATKTASYGISLGNTTAIAVISGIKINHSTHKFWRGIAIVAPSNAPVINITDCDIGYCAEIGLLLAGGSLNTKIARNYIHDCTSHGVSMTNANNSGMRLLSNIIHANGGDGVNIGNTSVGASCMLISGNTIDANTGDGIEFAATTTAVLVNCEVMNNLITNNSGYALRFSGASISDLILDAQGMSIDGTCHYNNTSGFSNLSLAFAVNTQSTNPSYTDAGGDDFSAAAAIAGIGSPLGGAKPIGQSSTYSYVDPGAAQRQETGGSSGEPSFAFIG